MVKKVYEKFFLFAAFIFFSCLMLFKDTESDKGKSIMFFLFVSAAFFTLVAFAGDKVLKTLSSK